MFGISRRATTRAFVSAVLVAGVVTSTASAAPVCGAGADRVPSATNTATIRSATLCLLNVERANHGRRPLHAQKQLRGAETGFARLMATQHFFSHVSPGGSTIKSRVQKTGYLKARHWWLGENAGEGNGTLATPRAMVKAWMHSAGHRANILNPRFSDIGVGVAIDRSSEQPLIIYATSFGHRIK